MPQKEMGPCGHLLYPWWKIEDLIQCRGPQLLWAWFQRQCCTWMAASHDTLPIFWLLHSFCPLLWCPPCFRTEFTDFPLNARCLLLNSTQKSSWSWAVSSLPAGYCSGSRKFYADCWEKTTVVSPSWRPCLTHYQPSQQDTLNGTTIVRTTTAF